MGTPFGLGNRFGFDAGEYGLNTLSDGHSFGRWQWRISGGLWVSIPSLMGTPFGPGEYVMYITHNRSQYPL